MNNNTPKTLSQTESNSPAYKRVTFWLIEVTVWQRLDKETQKFVHNHIEYGHQKKLRPAALTPEQQNNWRHSIWKGIHAYMDANNKIIHPPAQPTVAIKED